MIATEVLPRLPACWREEVRRRTEAALDLPDVEPSLVHGDLGGENLHYDAQGKWNQVVGNIVSEWTQIIGLVLLTKRLIERGSKESHR